MSIQADHTQVDVALPAAVPLTQLMPGVVDLVASRWDQTEATIGADWQLSRPGEPPLPASLTLSDNGIRHGDLLLLTRATCIVPAPVFGDVCETVSDTSEHRFTPRAAQIVGAAAALLMACLGASLLLHDGIANPDSPRAVPPSLVSCGALAAAIASHRAGRSALAAVTLAVGAIAFAGVAGFLVVPGEPGAPNVLLGAAAGAAMSAIGIRVTGCGAITLTAVASFAMLTSATALECLLVPTSLSAAGALSASAAVGLLTLAPRLSIAVSRLPLPAAAATGRDGDPETREELVVKADRAHAILSGLVCGLACSALVGATLAAHSGAAGGMAFATVTAAALLLRARSHTDLTQTAALLTAGICTLGAVLAFTAAAYPSYGDWMGMAAAGAAAAAIGLGFMVPSAALSPLARRGLEVLEYVNLATVVPLACWVCGVYAAVRGLRLT